MKRVALILMAVAVMAMIAFATGSTPPPPARSPYAGGWGMNPTRWDSAFGTWSSGLSLYDPNSSGGGGWVVGWNPTTYITYAPITLELWIEMYSIQTYHYTHYQWHRLGDLAENVCFTIEGTLVSNEGCYVLMTADPAFDPNYLNFEHNIGVGDDRNARDIPIVWSGRWGHGLAYGDSLVLDWTNLSWNQDELVLAEVTPCNNWFQFRGCFDLVYHEADGYYKLVIAGCPAPGL